MPFFKMRLSDLFHPCHVLHRDFAPLATLDAAGQFSYARDVYDNEEKKKQLEGITFPKRSPAGC
jgi:hypothetical protein